MVVEMGTWECEMTHDPSEEPLPHIYNLCSYPELGHEARAEVHEDEGLAVQLLHVQHIAAARRLVQLQTHLHQLGRRRSR